MIAPNAASAAQQSAPILTLKELERQLSPVKTASYRHYCVEQYFTCRDRWGGGWRFRRCMKWRGCWDAYVDYRERRDDYGGCRRWRHACAENWGYGNNDYYGCLRYHGCY
jgi:hypothetical protein